MSVYVYMLKCSDGLYYVGTTRGSLERRIAEHNSGRYGGFTSSRLPVGLVYHETFERVVDAVAAERRLKGWSHAKKEALIAGDFDRIRKLAKRRGNARANSYGD